MKTAPMAIELLEGMTESDSTALKRAVQLLEHPSLAVRLANVVGKPIELVGYALPAFVSRFIAIATSNAIKRALRVALRTLSIAPHAESEQIHKALVAATGAAGGAFGIASLPIELPVSTTLMLRSIADIARSEGEDLTSSEARLACVQVFALGGRSDSADASESGYFAVRGILAKSVTEAARYIANRSLAEEGSPVLVRFIALVASRFGVVVTEKVAAQAVPVIGALGGAAVNYVFVEHFQDVARGHFIVRRLERTYGKDLVRRQYDRLAVRKPKTVG